MTSGAHTLSVSDLLLTERRSGGHWPELVEVGTEHSEAQHSSSKPGQELLYHMPLLATNFELEGFRKKIRNVLWPF